MSNCPKCGESLPDPLLIAAYRLAGYPPGLWEIHMCPGRPLFLQPMT